VWYHIIFIQHNNYYGSKKMKKYFKKRSKYVNKERDYNI